MSTEEAIASVIPADVIRNLDDQRRRRKSRDDGRCKQCGHYRVICSAFGASCVFAVGGSDA